MAKSWCRLPSVLQLLRWPVTPAVGDSASGAATDAVAAGGSGVSLGSAAGPATAAVDTAGVVVA